MAVKRMNDVLGRGLFWCRKFRLNKKQPIKIRLFFAKYVKQKKRMNP